MDFPSRVDLEGLKNGEEGVDEKKEIEIMLQGCSSSSASTSAASSSSSLSSSSAGQNEIQANFLPCIMIKTDIKKMGVEISDERAAQLKNDVRRLSPEVVSLRERTLGEISLTPDSSFFDEEGADDPTERRANGNHSNEQKMDKLEIEEENGSQSSVSLNPEFDSSIKLNDHELPIKCNDQLSSDSVDDILVDLDSRTRDNRERNTVNEMEVEEDEEDEAEEEEAEDSILNHQQTSSSSSTSRSVIQKLAEDEEIVFGDANNVAQVQLQSSSSSSSSSSLSSSSSSSSPTCDSVSFIITYPEASPQSCSSTGENLDQDPLRETEETDSDSSERSLLQNNQKNVSDIIQIQNSASDSLTSCLSITQREIPIIETEQFTEDSAESLALATGNRDEVRSDGSDSGLGGEISTELNGGQGQAQESDSETSFLDRIPDDILVGDKDKNASSQMDEFSAVPEDVETLSSCEMQGPELIMATSILPALRSPPKSNLKRRLTDCMEGSPNPKRINNPEESQKKKRNIHFDAVTVYYFPRAQGFTCVPSQGGSTLGMSAAHTHAERFSLTEHAAEQRRIHRARLAQLRSERAANNVVEAASSSEDPSDDTDEEPSDTEELDIDSYYFLLPVPTWQRRALLRAAGVQKIDTVEKDECRDIRASRKHCGCGCKGYCDPESCPCSRAHVKCQVDRAGFPCGCSRDGCANSSGRIEFNPVRVRTHFIHTLMRLELEKKHREEDCLESQPPPPQQPSVLHQSPLRGVGIPLVQNTEVVSSCGINGSGFTTLHYQNPPEVVGNSSSSSSCQPEIPGTREDSLDLYAIRDDCYPTSEDAVDGLHHHHHHHHHHHNQRQQKHPLLHAQEFGQQNFQQQFQQQQSSYQDYQNYQQNLPSTSRGQFHHAQYQQQQQQQTPGFSHYSGYVGAENPAAIYDQNYSSSQDEGGIQETSQYTNLSSVQSSSLQIGNSTSPVSVVHSASSSSSPSNAPSSHHLHHHHHHHHHSSNQQMSHKLEPFSELLAGRYSYYGEIEANHSNHVVSGYQNGPSNEVVDPVAATAAAAAAAAHAAVVDNDEYNCHRNRENHEDNSDRRKIIINENEPGAGVVVVDNKNNQNSIDGTSDDCDENFGEIIKKSMVETVSA